MRNKKVKEFIRITLGAAIVAAAGIGFMALALLVVVVSVLLVLPFSLVWQLLAVLTAVVALTFLWCMRLYLGTYLFLPATEYKGARIIARLGRNENEIAGASAGEIIVKQNFIEKALRVCHVRQKGTMYYFRGVPEVETVKRWVATRPRVS